MDMMNSKKCERKEKRKKGKKRQERGGQRRKDVNGFFFLSTMQCNAMDDMFNILKDQRGGDGGRVGKKRKSKKTKVIPKIFGVCKKRFVIIVVVIYSFGHSDSEGTLEGIGAGKGGVGVVFHGFHDKDEIVFFSNTDMSVVVQISQGDGDGRAEKRTQHARILGPISHVTLFVTAGAFLIQGGDNRLELIALDEFPEGLEFWFFEGAYVQNAEAAGANGHAIHLQKFVDDRGTGNMICNGRNLLGRLPGMK